MSDERAVEGLEHLQAAAREMIAAARAFLDVAEDLVGDPERVSGALASLATIVDLAGKGWSAPRPSGRPAGAPPSWFTMTPHPHDAEDEDRAPASGEGDATTAPTRAGAPRRIRRIDVS